MLFSPEISYFIATIYFIINLCFGINVILFLKIYKPKDTILSPKVKLNYHLCTAYLLMAFFNIIPPIPLLAPGGFSSTYVCVYYIQIYSSAYLNITMYFFYTFMFRIALVTDKTNIKTTCRVIFYWFIFIIDVIIEALAIVINPKILIQGLAYDGVVFFLLIYEV